MQLTKMNNHKANYRQQSQSQKLTTTNSVDKQPSKIGILMLFVAAIVLYSISINELSRTVSGIVEAEFQENIQY